MTHLLERNGAEWHGMAGHGNKLDQRNASSKVSMLFGHFISLAHLCVHGHRRWLAGGLHAPAPPSDTRGTPGRKGHPSPVCTRLPSCVPGWVPTGLRLPRGHLSFTLPKVPHGLLVSVGARAASCPFYTLPALLWAPAA